MRLARRGAAAAAALFFTMTLATAASRDDFLYATSNVGGTVLPFRYFVPPGYDANQAYPLILFLHGAGERGNDNEAQLNNNANGAMHLLDDANLAEQPVFMIAPQCFADGWWGGAPLDTAVHIIDQVSAAYHIDPDRLYITGLSMGGMGTWSAVTAYPDTFAAAVPMSGNGDTAPAASVSTIPFWFFHAADDPTVNVAGSDNLVAALRDAAANVIYTRYDSGGHGIWPVAYTHPLLFSWIVAQQRDNPSTTAAPVLRILQPTAADTWSSPAATIGLAGSADNAAYPIDDVVWDLQGGTGGNAIGTSAWSVSDVALNEGANLLRVTAIAPSEHAAYAGHTTFNDSLRVNRLGDPIFADGFQLP